MTQTLRADLTSTSWKPARLASATTMQQADIGGRIVLGTPKSHQSRTVPIPRFLAGEIAQSRARQES